MELHVDRISITYNSNGASVLFCSKLYEKEALISAVYNFIDKYMIHIEEQDDKFKVVFAFKHDQNIAKLQEQLSQFVDHALDEQLRLQLERKTAKLRDLIVEHAFCPIENLKEFLPS